MLAPRYSSAAGGRRPSLRSAARRLASRRRVREAAVGRVGRRLRGTASARDIRALIDRCRAAVRERFGVELREEIVYLGDFEP